mmetsp:Transcript_3099/g.5214  ORF Transcript_3099/g.5214 Transcript_3099/m.5214 type:complete len:88 (+) Transcript_3099:96-359(+)
MGVLEQACFYLDFPNNDQLSKMMQNAANSNPSNAENLRTSNNNFSDESQVDSMATEQQPEADKSASNKKSQQLETGMDDEPYFPKDN